MKKLALTLTISAVCVCIYLPHSSRGDALTQRAKSPVMRASSASYKISDQAEATTPPAPPVKPANPADLPAAEATPQEETAAEATLTETNQAAADEAKTDTVQAESTTAPLVPADQLVPADALADGADQLVAQQDRPRPQVADDDNQPSASDAPQSPATTQSPETTETPAAADADAPLATDALNILQRAKPPAEEPRALQADVAIDRRQELEKIHCQSPYGRSVLGPGWLVNATPADFCHPPLYFEEANLERYGRSRGFLQPAVSGAKFFATIPSLPVLMIVHRPRCCYDWNHPYKAGFMAPPVSEWAP